MNPATALAKVLVDELVRCGLRDAVLAPGSRSTPLALELHAADLAGRLRLHVRIDERSASFLALGLARAARRPAAVVCTSGTAAANFHPAVVEANESGVPLLVLTADRPPELRHTAANQTVDQLGMYGSAVRWFCEVGVPEPVTGMVRYWRSLACRAWAWCRGGADAGDPGAVHLNLAFREPLVPEAEGADWPEPLAGRALGRPWTVTGASGPRPPVPLPGDERGVLVIGDTTADVTGYLECAARSGWPVLAEPSGSGRVGPNAVGAYHFLLDSPEFVAGHRPDVVVSVGRPGLSKPLLRYLRDAPRHVVVGGARWADPMRSATEVLPAGVPVPGPAAGAGQWLASWLDADRKARGALDAVLDVADTPNEPRLARDLAAALPDGALLYAGSSMPIRDLDQTMAPRGGLSVLAGRGASGIDGTVSTAIGAALAHQAAGGGPGFALLGDLTVLHDQNGLVLGPEEPRPDLAIVVVNNDGGGIFSMLPQAADPGPFERVFGTAHGVDFAALAAATGTGYRLLRRPAELPAALAGGGVRLIEVRTERRRQTELRSELAGAVRAAIG